MGIINPRATATYSLLFKLFALIMSVIFGVFLALTLFPALYGEGLSMYDLGASMMADASSNGSIANLGATGIVVYIFIPLALLVMLVGSCVAVCFWFFAGYVSLSAMSSSPKRARQETLYVKQSRD
jgi:hypothetical protein